jgi:hypothetical protein
VVTTGFAQLAEGKRVRVSDGPAQPMMGPPGRRPPGARRERGSSEAAKSGNRQRAPDGTERGDRARDQRPGTRQTGTKANPTP